MQDDSWYQRNKVRHNANTEAYYKVHKEEIQAYQAEYRERNRGKLAAQKREYYLANKERLNASMAEYAEANAEKIATYQKHYREANKERISDNAKTRVANRPEYIRRKCATRRQVLYRELRCLILNELGGRCYCCGLNDLRFLTIDHIANDGKEHRKLSSGKSKNGYIILLEIQKEGIPKDRYRAACYNCNCARNLTKDKICPHQIDRA